MGNSSLPFTLSFFLCSSSENKLLTGLKITHLSTPAFSQQSPSSLFLWIYYLSSHVLIVNPDSYTFLQCKYIKYKVSGEVSTLGANLILSFIILRRNKDKKK